MSTKMLCGNRQMCKNCRVLEHNEPCVRFELPVVEHMVIDFSLPPYELLPSYSGLGIAIDIGTTTIAAALCRSDSKKILKAAAVKNPQIAYGADVISRLQNALDGKLPELGQCAVNGINALIADLCSDFDQISFITVSGNTAMCYFFAQKNPACLAHSPFKCDYLFGETFFAEQFDLCVRAKTNVYILPCISAFVGSDAAAAIAASFLIKQKNPSFLIDIGTNGEIALYIPKSKKLFVCSTAAGPAFEGQGIRFGMRGVQGAIDSVTFAAGSVLCSVIGGKKAKGICGSGIIDAIALMRRLQVIDENGVFKNQHTKFELQKNIYITQEDVNMFLLAKSAVCAAVNTLLKRAGINPVDVQSVFIAGAFGTYMNVQNAAAIGLIPAQLSAKVHIIGNAALAGTVLCLQNDRFKLECESIRQNAFPVDLAQSADFAQLFIESLKF